MSARQLAQWQRRAKRALLCAALQVSWSHTGLARGLGVERNDPSQHRRLAATAARHACQQLDDDQPITKVREVNHARLVSQLANLLVVISQVEILDDDAAVGDGHSR